MVKSRVKRIVIDLDDTLTVREIGVAYPSHVPRLDVVARLREYQQMGFEIVIHTARNMRTFSGSIGKINVQTLPDILTWLQKHEIPFDEVIVGKPWCGESGFYVDDKSIRPDEFANLSYQQIQKLLKI